MLPTRPIKRCDIVVCGSTLTTGIRSPRFKLADELRQSSDDLTRMARTYVVTGDVRYEEYFNRILEIRNGEAPRPENHGGMYWDFVGVSDVDRPPDGEPMQSRVVRGVSLHL